MSKKNTINTVRNDNALITGQNSRSISSKPEVVESVKEAKAEKSVTKSILLPAKDHIMEVIAKEKAKVSDIKYFEAEKLPSNEAIADELRARRKYLEFLNGLENTIKITLKESQ